MKYHYLKGALIGQKGDIMNGWQKTCCLVTVIISATLYESLVLVGGYWAIIILGMSGWWWVFVVFMMMGSAAYVYKMANLIFLGKPAIYGSTQLPARRGKSYENVKILRRIRRPF